MAPKNIKLFQSAHSYLDYLFLLLDRCFSFYFSSGILSCSAVLVCNSEFYGLSFLTNFSLHLSPFPVFKALAFHSLILVKTETSSTNEISPYNTINFFLSISYSVVISQRQKFVISFILVPFSKDHLDFSVLLMLCRLQSATAIDRSLTN